MKKVLSLVLALALVLSLTVPAFATTVTDISKGTTMNLAGKTQTPSIELVIPAASKIVVNPYELTLTAEGEVAPDEESQAEEKDPTYEKKVFSAPMMILSKSGIELNVSATVTGKATGATLATKTIDETKDTANSVYAFVAFADVAEGEVDADSGLLEMPDLSTAVEHTPVDKTTGESKAVLLSSTATTAKVGKLAAVTPEENKDKATGLAFQVNGTANTGAKLANPWTNKMTVSATIAFTFMPATATATA